MKKVAIVGVEGSGKTVMLAGLGELYSKPDEQGYFLSPKNFTTASYVADKIERMRRGEWPTATAEDVLQGLDWTLRRKERADARPVDVCEISCLDFAGEVYRAAFGIKAETVDANVADEVEELKAYIRQAQDLIVLVNLRDVIDRGLGDPRVRESVWITKALLEYALSTAGGRKEPRAMIVLSQADSYAATIAECGGAKGVLEKYLRDVANNYGWLDIVAASAVDKTDIDGDGNVIPAEDFHLAGLKPVVEWILKGAQVSPSGKGAGRTGWNQKSRPVAKGAGGHEPTNQTRSKPSDEKVNVVPFGLTLFVSGGMAIACFATEHWWVGGLLAFLFLASIGVRGDKDVRQGGGWWILYANLLFVSGFLAVADQGWLSFIVALGGFGMLNRK